MFPGISPNPSNWLRPYGGYGGTVETRPSGVLGDPGPMAVGPFGTRVMEPKEAYGSDAEKAASGPRGVSLPWFLPFFDDQSGETQEMRLAYRQMIQRCPVVKGAMLGKIFGVAALDIKITPVSDDPGDIEVAEFVEWSFNQRIEGSVPQMIEAIVLHALMDGYSINEKVWGVEEEYGRWQGKHVLRVLKPKDVDRDLVPITDEFRNIINLMGLRYNGGLDMDPRDYVIFTHLPFFYSPTGTSDLRAAYGRYWTLDAAWKLRASGLANRSFPVLKGQYQTIDQKSALERTLAQARMSNFMSIPAGVIVEALEIAGGSQDEFRNAIADLREEIYLGIAGSMLQALTGQAGAQRGSSAAHKDEADLRKWYVAQKFCAILNDHEKGVIRDLTIRNFMGRVPPKAAMSGVDDLELAESLNIDKGMKELGWDHSLKELGERYGRSIPKDDDDRMSTLIKKLGIGQQQPGGGNGFQPPKEGQTELPQEMPEFVDDDFATDWGYSPGLLGSPERNGRAKVPA